MNLNQKILSNTGWIIGCKIIKALLTFVVTMITARYLGPAKYGIINYAASLTTFVTPLMMLGFDSVLVHEVVKHPDKEGETVGTAVAFSVVSGLLCMLGVLAFVFVANASQTVKIIVCGIYSLRLVFQALELIQYWFQAKLMAKYTATAMLLSYILVSVLQVLVLALGGSIYLYAFTVVLDFLVISIILFFQYCKIGAQKLKFSFSRGKEMLSESRHFIVSIMMVAVYAKTDTVMISLMLGDENTGLYTCAVNCASITAFVFAAIIDSFRPVIFEKLDKEDINGFENTLSALYSIITYLSLLQCVVMTVFARLVIYIMYGSDFLNASTALRIVVWYTTFSYYGTIRNIWILAEGKQKYLWKINLFGVVANIALNFILIPIMGISGAAIASLFTQFFTNVIVGFIIKPIRQNNTLMIKGLNPVYLKKMWSMGKALLKK